MVGAREADADEVALRLRDGRRLAARPADEVLERVHARVASHEPALWETAV